MSGDAAFEYPDEAGYPDGMGTLHEGIDEPDDAELEKIGDVEDDLDDEELVDDGVDDDDDGLDGVESELEEFSMTDEEDDEGL